jgi:hypothetical protein
MTMQETNLALMEFLGIDPTSNVTRIEVIASPDYYPKVIVTRMLSDSIWKTEVRMFKLVPYEA